MDMGEKIEGKKVKRYLTINKRIIFEGGIYHITQRAPGKELLFLEEADYLHFLGTLKEKVKKFNLDLFCFSLLPNHLHLLLRIKEKNLSQAMKNLFEKYADYFNKKYQRKGHVFCGRYRASLCNDESYFLAASIYIHLNPYKAGLCRDFKSYRWDSLGLYIGISKNTFINFGEILFLLSSQIDKARKEYLRILEESAGIKGGTLLDSSSVKMFIKEAVRTVKRFVDKNKKWEDLNKSIEDFKLRKKTIGIKDKNTRKYLIEQLLANGYSIREITQTLFISRSSFYRTIGFKDK